MTLQITKDGRVSNAVVSGHNLSMNNKRVIIELAGMW